MLVSATLQRCPSIDAAAGCDICTASETLFVQRQLPVRLTLYARTPTLLLFDYKSHYSIVLQEAQGQPFKTSSSKMVKQTSQFRKISVVSRGKKSNFLLSRYISLSGSGKMKIQKVFIVFAKKQEDYDRILMLISNNKRNIICSNAISIIELIYNLEKGFCSKQE